LRLETDIESLRQIDLFSGFDDDPLRLMAFGSEKLIMREGDILFVQGEPSDGGFLLLEGRIEMIEDRQGNAGVANRILPGMLLGELAMITQTKRPATAKAVRDCTLFKLPRDVVLRVLNEYPELAAILRERVMRRLSRFTGDLSRVEQRLKCIDEPPH